MALEKCGVASWLRFRLVANQSLDDARRLVDDASSVVVITGAGISTASGIPDFRGPEGVWTKDPNAERLSNIDVFMSSPEVRRTSWQRLLEVDASPPRPNPAHRVLVDFEESGKLKAIVTQNIDGLHIAAGSDPRLVFEVHGNTRTTRCLKCEAETPTRLILERVRAGDLDPRCDVLIGGALCGGILKTVVVSFGQPLPREEFAQAELLAKRCELLICVGSTLMVRPVSDLVPKALTRGVRLLIINAEPTPYDMDAEVVERGDITSVLGPILGAPVIN